MTSLEKSDILARLQSDILRLQRFKPTVSVVRDFELGDLADAFPNRTFPVGHIHEFLATKTEDMATTGGFIAGLLSLFLKSNGTILWVSSTRKLFPPALKNFAVQPDRFIFLDLANEKDVLWAMHEALKCASLTAVIAELSEVTFTESRRLQLAVEQSQVTGFVLRQSSRKPGTTACVSRWRITSLPSEVIDSLPGIGFPTWRVELLRMRNGHTGTWDIQWKAGSLLPVQRAENFHEQNKKAG